MRRLFVLLTLVGLLAPAGARSAPPEWGTAVPLPGLAANSTRGYVNPDVGLAGNGDAAVAFVDNTSTSSAPLLYTRIAGTWSSVPLVPSAGTTIQVAMNDRGDIAVAYGATYGSVDGLYLAYKPAGGPWELPTAAQYTDRGFNTLTAPSVAINERGDAVASWEQSIASPARIHTSVYTRPATGTGSWGAVQSVDDSDTMIAGISSHIQPSAPAAIDNAGNAIVLYGDQYAYYTTADQPNYQRALYAIRSARRAPGGTWTTPQDVTPRPTVDPSASVTPMTAPRYFQPLLAADPRSGSLIAGYFGRTGSTPANQYGVDDPLYIAGGSVLTGIGAGTNTNQPVSGPGIAAGPGTRAIGGRVQTSADVNGTYGPAKVSLTSGTAATVSGPLASLNGSPFPTYGKNVGLGAGTGGFAVAGSDRYLWVAPAGGPFGNPVDPWPAGSVATPGVAASCRGDGLAALYSSDQKQVYIADYTSGVTAVCGGGAATPDPTVSPSPTGSPTATVPAKTTATATPSATTSATPGPALDKNAPSISLPASNGKVTVGRSGVVSFRVGPASETVTGTITVTGGAAKAATAKAKAVTLGRTAFTLTTGATKTVKVKLSKAARKALRKHAKLKAQVAVAVRDAAGNATTKRLASTLKRAKKR